MQKGKALGVAVSTLSDLEMAGMLHGGATLRRLVRQRG